MSVPARSERHSFAADYSVVLLGYRFADFPIADLMTMIAIQ